MCSCVTLNSGTMGPALPARGSRAARLSTQLQSHRLDLPTTCTPVTITEPCTALSVQLWRSRVRGDQPEAAAGGGGGGRGGTAAEYFSQSQPQL